MKEKLLLVLMTVSFGAFAQHSDHDGHNHGAEPKVAANLQAEPPKANPNAPKIEFKETQFEFGEIPEGPQAKHEFAFKNVGKEPLTITACQASCGCTVPTCPKEPVLPGQTSKITAIYNTQGRVGPFNKSITITSNAEGLPVIVYIKGTVKETPPEKTMPIKEDNGMLFGN